jgi:hypothetical protein
MVDAQPGMTDSSRPLLSFSYPSLQASPTRGVKNRAAPASDGQQLLQRQNRPLGPASSTITSGEYHRLAATNQKTPGSNDMQQMMRQHKPLGTPSATGWQNRPTPSGARQRLTDRFQAPVYPVCRGSQILGLSVAKTLSQQNSPSLSNSFNEQRSSEMSSASQQHSEELETVVEVVEETVLTMDGCSWVRADNVEVISSKLKYVTCT